MPSPRTQHLNNVPRLRREKDDISLKILHQAGFETARQAATERHALTIALCPSPGTSLKTYIIYMLRLRQYHDYAGPTSNKQCVDVLFCIMYTSMEIVVYYLHDRSQQGEGTLLRE